MVENQAARLNLLRQTFPELKDQDLQTLNEVAHEQHYPMGSVLCQEGEVGETLFVLIEGEAGIFIHTEADQEIMLKTMLPAAYFGEMALLGNTTRAATVRAVVDCRTLEIDQETFVNLVDRNPALLRTLSRQIIDHLRNNDRAIIHALRQKNEDLATAYADLAEQERLRSDFIATLSHELRTPLTSAQGFLHLINKGGLDGDFLRQALDSVTRNVEKMVALINNLLVLYEMRLTTQELTDLNIVDLVIQAVGEVKALLNDTAVPITMTVAPDLPELHGDKNGLVLALRSVIENAFKFSPDNTPVHINICHLDRAYIRIDVIDHGVGIPEEARERIFELFYRVEEAGASRLFPGLGVGLSIAKFIVERHDGRIEVISIPDQGTTFSIFLACH